MYMEFTSDKYILEVVNMKDGMYTLTRNYDVAHVVVGEVDYNGTVYEAKKNIANVLMNGWGEVAPGIFDELDQHSTEKDEVEA